MLPSASPSGFTWQVSRTGAASGRAATASTAPRHSPSDGAPVAEDTPATGRVAQDRVEDRGIAQVGGDPGVRDRDHAQAGVLDLGTHDRRDQLPNAFGVPAYPCRVRHLVTSACQANPVDITRARPGRAPTS